MAKVKVEILRNVSIAGRPYQAGKVAELDESEAKQVIRMGKAREFVEEVSQPAPSINKGESKLAENPEGEGEDELTDEEKLAAVVEAIGELDPEDAAHFTQSGKPDANTLTELVGFKVSAALRDAAEAQFSAGEGDNAE